MARKSPTSEHRALALLRSERLSRTKGASCLTDLDKHIRLTTLWSRHWSQRNVPDHDIWHYITMRWPTLSQSDKQRIFRAVTDRPYKPYVAPIDRFIVVSKHNVTRKEPA